MIGRYYASLLLGVFLTTTSHYILADVRGLNILSLGEEQISKGNNLTIEGVKFHKVVL